MKYNFDNVITRKNTGSIKWDLVESLFGSPDVLPMWVADMDFKSPQPVIDAINKRAENGIFGYTYSTASYNQSIVDWMKRRHGWEIDINWLVFSPGIVPALNLLIKSFTQPGDKVILQLPVYYPFMKALKNNDVILLPNPLSLNNRKYKIDFDDLEEKAKDPLAKLLVLCNPHNPVGRVWTKEELVRLGDICLKNNILVISDEIHSDLILKGHQHTCFGSISEDFLLNSITCTAASKTFNLAGLKTSSLLIADPQKMIKYRKTLEQIGITGPNIFGAIATEAAYRHGEEWLEELLEYLQKNFEYLKDFIQKNIPEIKVIDPEGTYLVWLDFSELGMDKKSLETFMHKKAKVAFDEGYIFGNEQGEGFERINIACPRSILEEGLNRVAIAVSELQHSKIIKKSVL